MVREREREAFLLQRQLFFVRPPPNPFVPSSLSLPLSLSHRLFPFPIYLLTMTLQVLRHEPGRHLRVVRRAAGEDGQGGRAGRGRQRSKGAIVFFSTSKLRCVSSFVAAASKKARSFPLLLPLASCLRSTLTVTRDQKSEKRARVVPKQETRNLPLFFFSFSLTSSPSTATSSLPKTTGRAR